MSQKKERVLWRIFLLSLVRILIFRVMVSVVFWILSIVNGWIWTEPSLLLVIKSFINRILWMILLVFVPILTTLWIALLVTSNKNDYNPITTIKKNIANNIYNSDFNISNLSQEDIKKIKTHNFNKRLSTWLTIFLNIITLWFFWLFYYGFQHNNLPRIQNNDFWSWKAIWFMFIPLFNLYWRFIFWLKLTDRLNLQYTIRKQATPISRWLVVVTLIIGFVPYVNFIAMFILQSIVIYQIQRAINGLINE